MGHSTVMLSTFATLSVNSAKHLAAQRERPFAALRVTVEGPGSFVAEMNINLPPEEAGFRSVNATGTRQASVCCFHDEAVYFQHNKSYGLCKEIIIS